MNKQAKIALFTGRVPAYYGLLISKIEKTMIVLKAAQEKLLSALQAVAGIVERRHTLPILANVLMRKNGPVIELTTSDLEIQVRISAELGGFDPYNAAVHDRSLSA